MRIIEAQKKALESQYSPHQSQRSRRSSKPKRRTHRNGQAPRNRSRSNTRNRDTDIDIETLSIADLSNVGENGPASYISDVRSVVSKADTLIVDDLIDLNPPSSAKRSELTVERSRSRSKSKRAKKLRVKKKRVVHKPTRERSRRVQRLPPKEYISIPEMNGTPKRRSARKGKVGKRGSVLSSLKKGQKIPKKSNLKKVSRYDR